MQALRPGWHSREIVVAPTFSFRVTPGPPAPANGMRCAVLTQRLTVPGQPFVLLARPSTRLSMDRLQHFRNSQVLFSPSTQSFLPLDSHILLFPILRSALLIPHLFRTHFLLHPPMCTSTRTTSCSALVQVDDKRRGVLFLVKTIALLAIFAPLAAYHLYQVCKQWRCARELS